MADSIITDLPILTTPDNSDVLPIVDIVNNTTKQVTVSSIKSPYLIVDEPTTALQNNVTVKINHPDQLNSSLVLTPKGNGAFILGSKPDGTLVGGNARGDIAVDLQMSRYSAENVAGGNFSVIAGGSDNKITPGADGAIVCGGYGNTASRSFAVCNGGQLNTASDYFAVVNGGERNTASAEFTLASGYKAVANRLGMEARANGSFSTSTPGDAQRGTMILTRTLLSSSPQNLGVNNSLPSGADITTATQFILMDNQTVMVDAFIIGRSSSGTSNACYQRRCLIKRDVGAATTAIIGSVQTIGTDIESNAAWDATLTANTTDGGLNVVVTGTNTSINWFAELQFREVIFA